MNKVFLFCKKQFKAVRNVPVFLAMITLLLTACGKTPIIMPPSTGTPVQTEVPTSSPTAPPKATVDPLAPMRNAYNSGNYVLAAQLAEEAIQKPGMGQEKTSEAWRCLALSQTQLKQWTSALDTLERWSEADPSAEAQWDWVNLWGTAVNHISSPEARTKASALLYDNKREALARSRAAMIMVSRSSPEDNLSPLLGLMSAIYQAMPVSDRAEMEKAFAQDLRGMDSITLQSMDGALKTAFEEKNISEKQICSYPYALIRIEAARRLAESEDPQIRTQGTAELARLCASAELVTDKRRLPTLGASSGEAGRFTGQNLPVAVDAPKESLPFKGPANRSVALLLPMSGHYRSISNRIVRGADIAKKNIAAYGITLDIITIDTNQTGWQSKLAALPKDIIIGGPLRPSSVDQLKTGGLVDGRAIFAFTTRLDAQEEGTILWRFFPSLSDQVRSLLRFVSNNGMGVSSVASLYPGDAYGRRMTELFSTTAKNEFNLQTSATEYPPTQHDQWNAIAARILGVRKATPPMRPRPSFQALFLPDSWLGAQTMVPHILFHQETRLILMGTSLWEQVLWEMALKKKTLTDASAFTLAIFPGAWNPETTETAGKYLRQAVLKQTGQPADFWTALGYDFVRFATRMGSPEHTPLSVLPGNNNAWNNAVVNSRLQQAANMHWAMAPIQWTPQGIGTQALYLFTPVNEGYQLANPEAFRAVLEKTRQRFKSRWGRN